MGDVLQMTTSTCHAAGIASVFSVVRYVNRRGGCFGYDQDQLEEVGGTLFHQQLMDILAALEVQLH